MTWRWTRSKRIFEVQSHHLTLGQAQDIKKAANWCNERKPGLGKRFTLHIRQKARFIRQNPTAVAIRYKVTRTVPLDTFPYMIHFTIDEEQKLVIISAVLSTHRDPAIRSDRK